MHPMDFEPTILLSTIPIGGEEEPFEKHSFKAKSFFPNAFYHSHEHLSYAFL